MIKCIHYERAKQGKKSLENFSDEIVNQAIKFHKSFPAYMKTPLTELKNLAAYVGVSEIYVKDESYRFGLNSFKALGGSYAIGKYLASRLKKEIEELPFEKMVSREIKEELGDLTFVSATDGNHGRGVAWTANQLNQKSVIYMPKGSSEERLENIRAEGAQADITEFNYDDAVRLADKMAREKGWIMVQDTAWEGYEEIPTWIMQGYTTMAAEAYEQLEGRRPTHIFIQAGVGSLAGAVIGYFSRKYGKNRPIMTVVEPDKAACIYETALAGDGKRRCVTGDMDTIMAGLACGEPNTVSLSILMDYGDNFLSCPDYVAAKGMRIFANPLSGDGKIVSGESGASSFGAVMEILRNPEYRELKEVLKLDENSILLFFSSEGDTDRENYRRILWDGIYNGTEKEQRGELKCTVKKEIRE
jgi:diaminopropionate ammonia-lyase